MKKISAKKITYSAVCLALAIVLPYITGNIPEIGSMLCPMHIPVLLCGFICGPFYAGVVGFIAPILKSVISGGMPPMFPTAIAMAFELLAYGVLSGLLNNVLPRKNGYIYLSLVIAMLGGRVVWGIVRFILATVSTEVFTFNAFIAGAITTAIPGIILHILLIPVCVMALRRANIDKTE
ncbi:MAG: ECF transporter S component [Clostridia bacterium]|nr:ECF transporter S component [Clostridia bacterium]